MFDRATMRFGVAVLALVLGCGVQSVIGDPGGSRFWPLFLLYGSAVIAFVVSVGATFRVNFAHRTEDVAPDGPADSLTGAAARPLLALALVAGLLSAWKFSQPGGGSSAWLLHVAAVLSFIGAIIAGSPERRSILDYTIRELIPIAALIALAAFARVWQLEEFPFGTWYDEANNGIDAARVLADPSYRPVYVASVQMPAHFQYLVGLSFLIFGRSTASIRLVAAAFGIFAVFFGYLLFRRWFGRRIGFLAACLLAVMRYHLTVSRLGMQPIATPAFELAFLYFLDRALARRAPRDLAWLGLTLGFGLAFYYAFLLFPIALVAFAVFLGIVRWLGWSDGVDDGAAERRSWSWQPLALGALGFLLATAPVVQFAIQNPDQFFQRTGAVSIFRDRDEPNLAKALLGNMGQHLAMFNLHGDDNGRHNLPGEPMLDPVTGTLFAFGLALALRRWRSPPDLLMLLVFFIMLLGGILSLDYEAPQSLRSVGVIPAVVYFAILPLAALAATVSKRGGLHRESGFGSGRLSLVAVGALLLAVAYLNLSAFFGRQKVASNTWLDFSTPETIAAREMRRLAPTHDIILSYLFDGHPTMQFLAPQVRTYRRWTLDDRFPLTEPGSRGVAILFHPSLVTALDAARRYYPNAIFRDFRPPLGGDPVLYEAVLSIDDLRGVRGIVARYFSSADASGSPVKEEIVSGVAADWTLAPPVEGPFSAELAGTLYARTYGDYRFEIRGTEAATLLIDGWPIGRGPITLASGTHALRVRTPGERAEFALWWQPPGATQMQRVPPSVLFRPPVTTSGLLGTYYPSPDWTGPPAFARIDPAVAFYFQDVPLPRPYTVEWKGKVFAPNTGTYRFATDSIDESLLFISGDLLIENPTRTRVERPIDLTRGWHDLALRFVDRTSHTQIYLSWTPPGGSSEIVPSVYLSPPQGDGYPDVSEAMQTLAAVSEGTAPAPPPAPDPGPRVADPGEAARALTLNYVKAFGGPGDGPGRFDQPRAVAAAPGGRVLVADVGNKRVQILDDAGNFMAAIHATEEGFSEPFDLTIAANGDIVVLDSLQGWLYRFAPTASALGRFAGPDAQLYHPRGLCAAADDTFYVADTGGARIVRMSAEGKPLQIIGADGDEKERLLQPTDIALAADGALFVVDPQAGRIARLGADGKILNEFTIPEATSVDAPHVALVAGGSILVTAPLRNRIQQFSYDGRLLAEWGSSGSGPGQLDLPTGIAVQGNDIWIADTGNDRIQRWEIRR